MQTPPLPQSGQIVRVRTRTWRLEAVEEDPGDASPVQCVCLDGDAQGDPLTVNWALELNRDILSEEAWRSIGRTGFDPPRQFAAFFNSLQWNCLTGPEILSAHDGHSPPVRFYGAIA